MKLYHGTNVEFGDVDLERCPPNRDFGQGFYLTKNHKHAHDRAQDKVDADGGVVTVMEFDFDIKEAMKANPDLKVKRFADVCEEWALFVMFNRLRKENVPAHEYDIVEGPVANDKMFAQFRLYMNNRIRMNKFIKSLTHREPTHQLAFCSERAIDLLLEHNEPPRYKLECLAGELSAALIKDNNITTIEAMKMVYHSDVFAQIADYTTLLYRKAGQELYGMLRVEMQPLVRNF
jgi:hypothetical protein